MTRNATSRPPTVGARTTRRVEGVSEEPSSSICVHSIAMRKQTTAKPDRMPISTARKRKNWSSRMVKMRCVQVSHRARKPEAEFGFEGAADNGGEGAAEATPMGSVTGLGLRVCAPKARARDRHLAGFRRRQRRHFPFRKRGPSRPQWFRDASRCIANFLLLPILCYRRRFFEAAFAAALPIAIGLLGRRMPVGACRRAIARPLPCAPYLREKDLRQTDSPR